MKRAMTARLIRALSWLDSLLLVAARCCSLLLDALLAGIERAATRPVLHGAIHAHGPLHVWKHAYMTAVVNRRTVGGNNQESSC